MAFDSYTAPVLPFPPNLYNKEYFTSLIGTINRYFRQADSKAPITVDSLTSAFLKMPIGSYTATNGTTNNVSFTRQSSFVHISGPTAAFTFTGIYKGVNGEIKILFNSTSQNMTLSNQSASSDADNRIITNGGADWTSSGSGVAILIYSVIDGRWVVLSTKG